jgi:hypothetical protein
MASGFFVVQDVVEKKIAVCWRTILDKEHAPEEAQCRDRRDDLAESALAMTDHRVSMGSPVEITLLAYCRVPTNASKVEL